MFPFHSEVGCRQQQSKFQLSRLRDHSNIFEAVKHLCEIERLCLKKTLVYSVFRTLWSRRQIITKQTFSYWASRPRLVVMLLWHFFILNLGRLELNNFLKWQLLFKLLRVLLSITSFFPVKLRWFSCQLWGGGRSLQLR